MPTLKRLLIENNYRVRWHMSLLFGGVPDVPHGSQGGS